MKTTRIYRLLAGYFCIAAFVAGIAYSQTSNGDPENDIGGNDSPTGVTGDFNGTVGTGGAYDPYTGNAQRTICDLIVPGTVGAYPLKWSRFYDSRDPDALSGMSVGWRHSYQWTMSLNTGEGVGTPDGRWLDFNEPSSGISERSGGPGRVLLGDGGQLVFEPVGYTVNNQQVTRFRLVQIVDPHGLATVLSYETTRHDQNGNAFYRVARITEPAGKYLQLNYHGPSETDQIASVQVFDKHNGPMQSVSYTYAPFTQSGSSQTFSVLTRVDYSDGTAAHYTYQNDNSSRGGSPGIPLLKTCDDVRYGGAMRQIEYLFGPDRIRGKLRSEKKPGTGEAVSTLTFPTARNAAQTRIETRGDSPIRTFTYSSSGRLISYTDFKNANPTSLSYDGSNFLGSVKDAANHETIYTRESTIGQLKRLTHPGGTAWVDFDYSDPNNPYYLTSRTDERGYPTLYDRDANRRVWQIRYPDGATEEFYYTDLGQLRTHRRRNGAYEHFEYDSDRRLSKAWNPTSIPTNPPANVPYTRFEYYPSGHPWADRVSVVFDPRGSWTQHQYDLDATGQPCAGRGLVTKITHVDGTYLSFGYDPAGNLLWQENELRERTALSYDDYGRPIAVIPPAPAGPIALTYEPSFGPPNPYLHTAEAAHFITDGAAVTVEKKYDQNFRLTSATQVDGTASPPTTRFEYWPVGTLQRVRDPRNKATAYAYDNRNRLETVTDALSRTTTFHRDPAGNIDWIDRPDGRRQSSTYDEMSRVRTTIEPFTGAANKTTTFTYWPSGRVHTIQDNNQQTTRFEYDYSDRQQFMFYPDNTYQQWGYDEANNLVGHRTVGGKIQRFQPDARNRITDMWWDPGNVPDWAHFEYDAASRLITANNQAASITRQYDPAGRLLLERQNVYGQGEKIVEYQSDGAGKATGMGIAGTDYQFAYQYDAIGRLEQILNVQNAPNATTKSLWYQYSYDAASNEIQRYCPMNGVAQIYQRDDLGRLERLILQKATEPQYARAVTDPAGGIVNPLGPTVPPLPGLLAGITNLAPKAGATIPAVGTVISNEHYGYNAMDQATSISRNDGQNDGFGYDYSGQLTGASYSGPNARNVSYSLDAVGNRSQVNDNGVVQGYSPNPNYRNQYVAAPAGTVTNGVEHEIAGYGGVSYAYLGDRQLASVTGAGNTYQLAYDAFGRCVKRTLNGVTTYYTYDGAHPIYEWKADGSRAGWNLYGKGVDEILLRADYVVVPNGQGYFFQQDRLGSVTHLTGFAGETIESYRYDAFGVPTTTYTGGSFNNRFKFTGREYQSSFGIYEYRARAYHPGLGRFLSEDPIGFAAGDTNLFRYCGGDPVNFTDPFGLDDNKGRIKKQNEGIESTPNYYGNERADSEWGNWEFPTYGGEGTMDVFTIGGPPRSGPGASAGVPGGLNNSATGLTTSSGSGPGSGSADGSGPGGGSRGTPTGNGNPYFDNGHFLTDLGKGFQQYNLPAHAAFWEEYAQWVPTFIPGMGGIGRVGTVVRGGLRVKGLTEPSRIYSAQALIRRASESGPFHNFPQSFNAHIFSGTRTIVGPNYVTYSRRGFVNGHRGTFEIGVRPSASGRNEVITHRFFRPD